MDSVSSRFFLFKTVASVMFSNIGVFLLIPSLIAFSTKFPAAFDNKETDCSIKVAFSCMVISTCIETLLWCWTILVIVVAVETDGFCNLKCYHVEVLLHFISFGCTGVGVSIFALRHNREVWYWIFAVGGGACAGANAFIGCCCQNVKRRVEDYIGDMQGVGDGIGNPKLHV
ncbi:uncharacterized protein LOC125665988 [Ostrea edulis]|uniref:uncharacterized protein LOC125665988 n=1 Tax=Ostrea edulis TaxID=37623 RepID=UPI0020949F52|nr:uncharacterized protein LOC125665988 [Ostrea edulis]